MFFDEDDLPNLSPSSLTLYIKKNGYEMEGIRIELPTTATMQELFDKAQECLGLDLPVERVFFSNGFEVSEMSHIEQNEVLYVSTGGNFRSPTRNPLSRNVANYILGETLGEGGYGEVVKAVDSTTKEEFAMKLVKKSSFSRFEDIQRVYTEIDTLRALRHPNVIRMVDVVDHPEYICFVMELASGGELRRFVERHGPLDENISRHIFNQIAKAVHYCHSKRVVHRDLKLENILMDEHNCCKIVDFGLADFAVIPEIMVTDAGTEAYLAPEVYRGESVGNDPFKIDVWSLGVILYALTHGKLPFERPAKEVCERLEREF
ncbi:Ovarian-specific serine/threonine-protein kinase Lok, putative [Perkinsus marinus ATCC 50983]|uniref:Ovarian-specific serine/threonine-protein kinase Lok, putative n=1 Tax=Perkinsus marinus (strain ATCC 50983 / TXsc) TaxID=423536 RepID=C5LK95_PERM5|nr:Ovarian-specific serine/threonine-protein kinase Lok, putative [Perkinsus marinus ATCC 50983]EER02882.1 Ovarian-specific serine/threonine-protein kinase Lok, putative [Perkinsus marinus ATCC 50983]|eukprot:XP_002771066.1 Ovarian-specific serine/threonine-protein kinase Lok, putative [Perkinsus marinus ATCC 50983]